MSPQVTKGVYGEPKLPQPPSASAPSEREPKKAPETQFLGQKSADCIQRSAAIVGSTASGKSALALAAAKTLGGEIISVDSMQVYRKMDIGTAKPTAAERAAVPHHMIDICDPETPYSCADFAVGALHCAAEITARGNLPIFCGGTGLYLDSVLRGGAPDETAADEGLRASLAEFLRENGAHALHERLREVDPESADAIHENNTKRVIRALEVALVSGKPKSAWDKESREKKPALDLVTVGLFYHDRSLLYRRIERRVDEMLAAGLLEETERLLRDGVFETNATAAGAIGYKELLGALTGKERLDEAVERLKTATRRYAKRQVTWFSAKPYVLPLWCDDGEGREKPFETILSECLALFSANGVGQNEK